MIWFCNLFQFALIARLHLHLKLNFIPIIKDVLPKFFSFLDNFLDFLDFRLFVHPSVLRTSDRLKGRHERFPLKQGVRNSLKQLHVLLLNLQTKGKGNVQHETNDTISNESFQALWIQLQPKKTNVICAILYRQHNSPESFQNYFKSSLDNCSVSGKPIYT